MKFKLALKIDNIGPHNGMAKIDFQKEVETNKTIFYAVNGTGKSFISRTFRLAEPNASFDKAEDLLTIGQKKGTFSLTIDVNDDKKDLSVSLERGKTPCIQNNSGLIFHVFNSDFVEENIAPNNYSPDGEIEGYILGKVQIDLSEEKRKLKDLESSIEKVNKRIDEAIASARRALKQAGVVGNTSDLSYVTRQGILNDRQFDAVGTYDEVLAQIDRLSKVPENLDDVVAPVFSFDTDFFPDMEDSLLTIYPKSEWDEDFVLDYKSNRTFIEQGLELSNAEKNICPFCKQPLEEQALQLIKQYNAYRNDQEGKVIAKLDTFSSNLKALAKYLQTCSSQIKATILEVNKIKSYFPSIADFELSEISLTDDNLSLIRDLDKMVQDKMSNLSLPFDKAKDYIRLLKLYIDTIKHVYENNFAIIGNVNRTKNDSTNERLKLRRKLCWAKYVELKSELAEPFNNLTEIQENLRELQESISRKEQQEKISKRDKVFETLTTLLNIFFDGKYIIDKETFQITFQGNKVGAKASRILSDGEKSIVAYCYYLATAYLLIDRVTDCEKLFFIIDDPISSMDFHYVYLVAQSLRDIKTLFGIASHERIWVFTHNIEFLSIITRNHILNSAYTIKPGHIESIDSRLLMPYESHLSDIVKVAKGELLPTHTTANSIRHVLETICRFEYPEKGIENYISENNTLSQNAYIFSICQDLSHGGMRNQLPYTNDVLISACIALYDFMNEKYKGQIEAIH